MVRNGSSLKTTLNATRGAAPAWIPSAGEPARRYPRALCDAFNARADDMGPQARLMIEEPGRTLDQLDRFAG